MKYFSIKMLGLMLGTAILFSSCFNDLDTVPTDKDEFTSNVVYDDPGSYEQVLAKLYAGLAVTGQQGPAGQADISGIDEGFGQYLRGYWYMQELTTDEAVVGWNDQTIQELHNQAWTSSDVFISAFYSRVFYQIVLCNEFLRETTDAKLDSRNVDAALRAEIATFRAEARFLRALSYWHALDLFRNVPFVTEDDAVGSFFPEQIQASDLFNYIESELLAIESEMAAPLTNEYGRADRAAAWMLLAKLYLNAEVYVGTDRSSDCVKYCGQVIDAGFTLEDDWEHLFLADNNKADGVIFPITFDGQNTRTYGGTTFIIHAGTGGSMIPADLGIDNGWGGTRTTKAIVNKFPAIGSGSVLVEPNEGGTYSTLGVPGAYQGWDPADENTVIGSLNDDGIYEGYINVVEAGSGIKITDGPTWDVNYGDTDGDGILEEGGADIIVPEAGYYRVEVNLNDLTYSLTKTEWAIVGSATPGGWDNDTDMTYDETEGAWTILANLVAGEMKFRANNDWAINFGDDGADALLGQDGANINIPNTGTYLIKLYLGSPDYTYSIALESFDARATFYTEGQNLEIEMIPEFTEGYAVNKFKNITSDGAMGKDLEFTDTDFPMFRLADAYLMYAEGVLRGGGGDLATATNLVNQIRQRAYGGPGGNVTEADLTLDFILDERAREFLWECHRRTDLIRFGKFSESSYVWPWKGGVKEGASTSSHLDVFPIPATDLGANPNLSQNTGY